MWSIRFMISLRANLETRSFTDESASTTAPAQEPSTSCDKTAFLEKARPAQMSADGCPRPNERQRPPPPRPKTRRIITPKNC